ncbi:hypothetical protein L0F63_003193 [Massospora cicadina]|nr:hypothetical protein L0F63_003193 [Massospora cicadina]
MQSSHFKKAQPIYSGISETRGGGSSSFSGKKKGVNFEEEENNEEYEDAELMIHVEGGEQLKHDDAMGTKEELLAAEVSRQLSGLDLHEDKMAAFVDSFDVGKREDVPNSGLPLVFMQLPAVLPHMAKKASVPPENMDDSLGLEAKQEIIADSPIEQLSGHVGKLLFYKSGKVQLRFGQVLFDVSSATCNLLTLIDQLWLEPWFSSRNSCFGPAEW